MAPWPPFPTTVNANLSDAAISTPGRVVIVPVDGRSSFRTMIPGCFNCTGPCTGPSAQKIGSKTTITLHLPKCYGNAADTSGHG
eukprot:1161414-Pelagomonas_calceolata.AAC.8